LGLIISLRWQKDPFWFAALDKDEKELLIAEYTLSSEDKKQRERRRERITNDRIQKQLDILKERKRGLDG
jgi:hypothetical protein